MRLLVLAVVGCGGSAAPPIAPVNTAPPSAPFALPADGALGWLAIAPQPKPDNASWVPATDAMSSDVTALLPSMTDAVRGSGLAVDSSGTATRVVWNGVTSLHYGCDNNSMSFSTFESADHVRLTPGPVWIAPDAIEKPSALQIRPEISTPSRMHFAFGRGEPAQRELMTIDLVKTGDATGTRTIAWHGKRVYGDSFKRVLMSGADNAPIQLDDPGEVAVPIPIAAWSFGESRAALVVFRTPGYEGSNLEVLVVGEETAREVKPMQSYLYYCAF